MSLLAHVSGGRGDLPLPSWLFVWGAVVAVGLAVVALRASWPRPRLAAAADGRPLPELVQRAAGPLTVVLRGVGLVALGVLLVAGLWGESDPNAVNIAPVGVYVGLWIGVQALSVLLGDAGRALSPFDTLAVLLFGRRRAPRTDRTAPPWTAAVMLASFAWMEVAYHSPNSPRPVGLWLAGYTVAAVAGAGLWGRDWLRTGEGFGAFFSLVGRTGVLARDGAGGLAIRPPVAGLGGVATDTATLAVVAVALGAAIFDGLSQLDLWQDDVVGDSTGWSATLVSTVGLAFTVVAVAAVWIAAARARDRDAAIDPAPLVPLAVAWLLAHRVALLLIEAQSLVAIASDPFGQGWDLFGTAENGYWFPTVTLVVWLQAAALVAGHVTAVIVMHDRAVGRERPAAAVRSSFPTTVVLAASAAGAMWLLLGV